MADKVDIYPSIMCSKPWDIKEYVKAFEEAKIAGIHFDVMDGHYVPNVMLGSDDYGALKEITELPIDIHVMSTDPEGFYPIFEPRPGDRYSFHPEVCKQPYRLLERTRQAGAKAGLVLSPGVPVDWVRECLSVTDFVIIMAVSPGFAGQKMVPDHLDKLRRVAEITAQADHPIEIVIDGNTTVPNAKKMLEAGATGLIVGTSSMMKEGPAGFVRLHDQYLHDLEA